MSNPLKTLVLNASFVLFLYDTERHHREKAETPSFFQEIHCISQPWWFLTLL